MIWRPGIYFKKSVLSAGEFYRKPYMAGMWGSFCRNGLYCRRLCIVCDGGWYPFRIAVFQAGGSGALAIWQAGHCHAQQHGMSLTFLQYYLAPLRRVVYGVCASCFRRSSRDHDHRNSLCAAASQAGRVIVDAVWPGGYLTAPFIASALCSSDSRGKYGSSSP